MHLTILKTDSKGFKHNHQSVRVSVDLENYFNEPAGLNLTKFILYGLLNHSNKEWGDL
jgi:dGTP triphosphohydrolase